jgi:Tfp pilus assembly protein PilP
MMRNLGILLLLSAAAFAQAPAAAQNSAVPPTVKAKPAMDHASTSAKPAPAHVKVSAATAKPKSKATVKPATASVAAATPKKVSTAKAPVKHAALSASPKEVSVHGAAGKPVVAAKPKPLSVQVAAGKPGVAAPKAISVVKPGVVAAPHAAASTVPVSKSGPKPHVVAVKTGSTRKHAMSHVMSKPATAKVVAAKPAAHVQAKTDNVKHAADTVTGRRAAPSIQESKSAAESKPAGSEIHTNGRDPFVSPVVAMGAAGSGCSAGKRCLAIDQIALRGVVKSESGMIAVVTNALAKAYFLRENDPVFNGYVVKITGDSIIFKETFRDKLGKTLTRDVTKSITRPVA